MKVELINGKIINQDVFFVKRYNRLVLVNSQYLTWYDQIVYFMGSKRFRKSNIYDLDPDLCYFFGSFFSYNTHININWRMNKVSFMFINDRLIRVLNRLNIKYKITNKKNIKVYPGVWSDYLQEKGILDLKIPDEIINGSEENSKAFLDGFFSQNSILFEFKFIQWFRSKNKNMTQGLITFLSNLGYNLIVDKYGFIGILNVVSEETMKIMPIKKIFS